MYLVIIIFYYLDSDLSVLGPHMILKKKKEIFKFTTFNRLEKIILGKWFLDTDLPNPKIIFLGYPDFRCIYSWSGTPKTSLPPPMRIAEE